MTGMYGHVLLPLLGSMTFPDLCLQKKVSKLSKANMMVPFLCLPPEIIFHVLCFLQPKDLAQMQLTCRSLSKYGVSQPHPTSFLPHVRSKTNGGKGECLYLTYSICGPLQ